MAGTEVTLEMPDSFDVRAVHPDLLALAALAAFSPWIGKRLRLPFGVSTEFSETCANRLKIEVPNTASFVQPRNPGADARPGLSFSAGVDSLACLAIMPENTVPVFSHRSAPKGKSNTMYRDDAPLHAIEQMNAAGRETYKVTSNLEWLRDPVGFGVDPSPAVPLILLADYFNLDAIAFGTIAEAAYRTGSEFFVDYAERIIFTKWQAAFQAAGIEYYNCVAPLSEMGTTKITRESKFGHLAQSCVRGLPGEPCANCVKCFRKSLIEASFSGEWPDEAEVSRMMSNRAIKSYLSTSPIRLELILAAALSKYDGSDPMLHSLQRRLMAKQSNISFTGAWYGPGITAMVPEKYRAETIEALNRYLPQMTPQQEEAFEKFDIRPFIKDLEELGEIENFQMIMNDNQHEYAQAK